MYHTRSTDTVRIKLLIWGTRWFLNITSGSFIGTVITYYLAKVLGNDALHVIFGEEKVISYVRKLNRDVLM